MAVTVPTDGRRSLRAALPPLAAVAALLVALALAAAFQGGRGDRHLLRAENLLASGQDAQALAAYQDALDRNPTDAEAVWGVAQVHLRAGSREMAARYLQQYLSLAPNGPHAEEARKALEGEPTDERPVQGGPPAPEQGEQGAKGAPAAGSYFQKAEQGRSHELAGRTREAIAAYEAAARVTAVPIQAAQALENAARCAARLEPPDYGLAAAYYSQAAEFYRRSNQHQEASRCSLQAGHLTALQAATGGALPSSPTMPPASGQVPAAAAQHVQAAKDAFAQNDYARAAQEARLAGDDAEALFVLGSALIWLGDWESARDALERCVAVAPNGPRAAEARSQLGSVTSQRLILQSVFDDGGPQWQYSGTGARLLDASSIPGAPLSGFIPRGMALAVAPAGWARAPLEPVVEGAVELWAAVTGGGSAQIGLAGEDGPAAEPLAISDHAWGDLRGASHVGQGWHQVSIAIRQETIEYFVDRSLALQAERKGPVGRLEVVGTGKRGEVLVDSVRVVAW